MGGRVTEGQLLGAHSCDVKLRTSLESQNKMGRGGVPCLCRPLAGSLGPTSTPLSPRQMTGLAENLRALFLIYEMGLTRVLTPHSNSVDFNQPTSVNPLPRSNSATMTSEVHCHQGLWQSPPLTLQPPPPIKILNNCSVLAP